MMLLLGVVCLYVRRDLCDISLGVIWVEFCELLEKVLKSAQFFLPKSFSYLNKWKKKEKEGKKEEAKSNENQKKQTKKKRNKQNNARIWYKFYIIMPQHFSHTQPTRGYFVYLRCISVRCDEYFCERLVKMIYTHSL